MKASALLFLTAAAGLTFLGLRVVAGERAVAERTARERLSGRARGGAGLLVAAAARLARRAALGRPDAVASRDGAFLRPVPPRRFGKLVVSPARDPEGEFYLASGQRAEVVDHDLERAAGLYRAAAAEGRDRTVREIALYRLAALWRRRGEEGAAGKDEAAFLSLLRPKDRTTLRALVVRARARPPDRDLARDLLDVVASPDEPIALGLLRSAGLDDPAALSARREALVRLTRLQPILAGPAVKGDGCVITAGRLVAFVHAPDGSVRFAEGPLPDLPAGVRIATSGKIDPRLVVQTVAAGEPLRDVSVRASTPRAEVQAAANRSAIELGAALFALVVAGSAALVLSVRAAKREAAAAREKAAFATKVGHDLRTPLALIRMYAETLAAGKVEDRDQAREFAGIAAREAERLSGMVGDVLDLSRVAEGDGALACRDLDLAGLVRDVVEAHRPLVERAGMRLGSKAEGPVRVFGDPAALRGAVANLVENALRHASEGGEIKVECAAENGEAVIRVKDRGPGIPGPIRESLFERFVRGPDEASRGAGLGLALVREVARAHGGEATAEDREGGGAVMSIRLPGAGEAR